MVFLFIGASLWQKSPHKERRLAPNLHSASSWPPDRCESQAVLREEDHLKTNKAIAFFPHRAAMSSQDRYADITVHKYRGTDLRNAAPARGRRRVRQAGIVRPSSSARPCNLPRGG